MSLAVLRGKALYKMGYESILTELYPYNALQEFWLRIKYLRSSFGTLCVCIVEYVTIQKLWHSIISLFLLKIFQFKLAIGGPVKKGQVTINIVLTKLCPLQFLLKNNWPEK